MPRGCDFAQGSRLRGRWSALRGPGGGVNLRL